MNTPKVGDVVKRRNIRERATVALVGQNVVIENEIGFYHTVSLGSFTLDYEPVSTKLADVNLVDLLAVVITVGRENPNQVTEECLYFREDNGAVTDQPCCIIGHGLARLGVHSSEFTPKRGVGVGVVAGSNYQNVRRVFNSVSPNNLSKAERSALDDLATIQSRQDARRAWGIAVGF